MLKKADIDNDGALDFNEFIILMSTVERGNKQYDDLIDAFQVCKLPSVSKVLFLYQVIDVLATAEYYKKATMQGGQRKRQTRGTIPRDRLYEMLSRMGERFDADELNGISKLVISIAFVEMKSQRVEK